MKCYSITQVTGFNFDGDVMTVNHDKTYFLKDGSFDS